MNRLVLALIAFVALVLPAFAQAFPGHDDILAMKAHAEGSEIFTGTLLSGASSHSSLLSLPYALENLVPLIELAADGNPATVVPGGEAP